MPLPPNITVHDLPDSAELREFVRAQLRKIDRMVKFEGEHSERGPSTAHRWRRCAKSVALSRGLPNTAGKEAALGTVFHEFAAICVEEDLDPQEFVGARMEVSDYGPMHFDQEMADSMRAGLDLIRSYENEFTVTIVERKFSLREWVGEGEFGTADVLIIDLLNFRVICFDWKYGQGVMVHPEMNDQAMLYVLGAYTDIIMPFMDMFVGRLDPEKKFYWIRHLEVHVVIEQPRGEGGGGVWKTNMEVILHEGDQIKKDAKLTEQDGLYANPGEKQCKFCPAGKHNACRERADFLFDMIGAEFDAATESDIWESPFTGKALSPEERSRVLVHKQQIEAYLDELHKEAYRDAEHGRPTPGMKLVPGRRPGRKWKDENKAEVILKKHLGQSAYSVPSLLSPSALEDTVGKRTYSELYAKHVDTGTAKPVLVVEDDPREAFSDVTAAFEAEDDFESLV